jgi:beta-glucosidase
MGLPFGRPILIYSEIHVGEEGQETYGEDPFLTAAMGTAFVKGIQAMIPLS